LHKSGGVLEPPAGCEELPMQGTRSLRCIYSARYQKITHMVKIEAFGLLKR
jgi:hypothetical protein